MVWRGSQTSAVKAVEKEDIQEQESCIKMVNINLTSFNSNHSVILAKQKTSSKQATMMVPYKVDMGCDGNIMPFDIFKKIFPKTSEDRLVAMEDTTMLRTYNSTTIEQLGTCDVVIEHNNKLKKICIFFVVPGDRGALLGMLSIELLNILQDNCNTIGTKKEEKGANYKKNKRNATSVGSEQCYVNTGPEKDCDKKDNSADCCTNTVSSLNSNKRPCNTSLPMVKDNTVDYLLSGMTNNEPETIETNKEIEYFLPCPNKENDKRASTNITKQIQREFEEVFMGIGCFEGMFSLHVQLDNKSHHVPLQ